MSKHGKRKWESKILKITNGIKVVDWIRFMKKVDQVLSRPFDPSKREKR